MDLLVTVHRKQGDELPLEKVVGKTAPAASAKCRGVARAAESILPNVLIKGAGEKDQC